MAKKRDSNSELNRLANLSRNLAKRANQRMVRLEKHAKQSDFYKSGLQYSYKTAQKDIQNIKGMTGNFDFRNSLRFRESTSRITMKEGDGTKRKFTDEEMINFYRAQIAAEQRFLDSVTSTVGGGLSAKGQRIGGMKEMYDRRTATINEKYGTDFTPEELQRFFESQKQGKLQAQQGSDIMFKTANELKKMGSLKRDMKEYAKNNKNIDDSSIEWDKIKSVQDFLRAIGGESFTDDPVLNKFISMAIKGGFNASNLGLLL